MANINDVKPGDRLFIKTQPGKRARVVVVASVDRDAETFTTTTGEALGVSLIDGWDLAGDLFFIPGESQ